MTIKRLEEILALDKITIEQKIEGVDILLDLNVKLEDKEVYVKEPDDIDDEPKMVYTEAQLKKLRENAVVAIANSLGIEASVKDRKDDTIKKILDFQK